jgi:hypothetical protein
MISARKVISLIAPDNAYYQILADIADYRITDETTLPPTWRVKSGELGRSSRLEPGVWVGLGESIHDSQAPVFESLYCWIQPPGVGLEVLDLQIERGVREDPGQQDIEEPLYSVINSRPNSPLQAGRDQTGKGSAQGFRNTA